jgi:hypothetical protein
MGLEILVWKWLTMSELVYFIRPHDLTNTWNSWSHRNINTNIRHCVVNIKMPHQCKRLIFNMLKFNVHGILLGLPMKLQSTSSIIGWTFSIFVLNNGEVSFYMYFFSQSCLNFMIHNSFFTWLINLISHACKKNQSKSSYTCQLVICGKQSTTFAYNNARIGVPTCTLPLLMIMCDLLEIIPCIGNIWGVVHPKKD